MSTKALFWAQIKYNYLSYDLLRDDHDDNEASAP